MIKVNLPQPLPGRMFTLGKTAAPAARFMALAALIFINSALAVVATAQRTDNRRLFWTGSNGSTWDNSTASWMTTGSFLAYAHIGGAVWLTADPLTGDPIAADPAATYLSGDVAIFDSTSDVPPAFDPNTGLPIPGDPLYTRTINIASEGVTVSDVVVSGPGSFIFTGGAMIADPSSILPGSIQLTGTGVGVAANVTRPTGSLVKTGAGRLTLSNTAANRFPGGIHLMDGVISVTDKHALGDNTIITAYITNAGGVVERWGDHIGKNLLNLIQRPSPASTGNTIPAVVQDSAGALLPLTSHTVISSVGLHIAPEATGIDIAGDIFLGYRLLTLDIEGDSTEATISGRILGTVNDYGAAGGTLIKEGRGTLFITGTQNSFNGRHTSATVRNYTKINAGRVVITSPYALGTGAIEINGGILEFRGVVGTMRQAFIGGGVIQITQGSDVTFNWRNGTLDGFDGMSGNGQWDPAMNDLSEVTVSGQSRFTAIASGTYTTVLGGAAAYVKVTEGSSLVLGREGLSSRGSGSTKIPMTYAILANRIDLTGESALVLNPNAYLSTGALIVNDDSLCTITFGASGVSRLRWQDGVDPDSIFNPQDPANINSTPSADTRLQYIIPNGMKLYINDVPVPVSPNESIPTDSSSSGWCREYVLVNQGANPLKDMALTMNAIDALHDTLSLRLADELIDPVTNHAPSRGRKWVNDGWIRYIMSEIEYDAGDITTPGMTGRINNVVGGFDGLLPGRIIVGIHVGIGENNLDTTNDTNLRSKQYYLGVHAAQRFGNFHLAATVATGKVGTDTFRIEGSNSIRGKWDTSYYAASIEAGATFNLWQKFTLRPFAGLRYSNLKVGNYYERGLSPLIIEDFSDTSAKALYGVNAGHKLTLFKRDFAFNFSLGRKHAVKTPRTALDAHYFDAPNTLVALERGDYYSTATTASISARVATSRNTIVGLACDYETASSYNRLTGTFLIGYTW